MPTPNLAEINRTQTPELHAELKLFLPVRINLKLRRIADELFQGTLEALDFLENRTTT